MPIFAAETVTPVAVPAIQTATLYIDWGFIGHPVDLKLFDGQVRISWDARDVIAPGTLDVTFDPTTSAVTARWSSSYLFGPKGVRLGIKPPGSAAFDQYGLAITAPFAPTVHPPTVMRDGYMEARVGPDVAAKLESSPIGLRQGTATWYSYKHCDCAASPDFPKGTQLRVSLTDHPETSVVVTVNDYGPDRNLFPNRVIDLDSVAFKQLAPLSLGLVNVTVDPVMPSSTAQIASAP